MDGQDIPFEEADQIAIDRRIYNGQGKEDAAERGHTMLMVASML